LELLLFYMEYIINNHNIGMPTTSPTDFATYGNSVLCSNTAYTSSNFKHYNEGVANYDKLTGVYSKYKCGETKNDDTQITINLTKEDYLPNTPVPNGYNIKTNCKELRGQMIYYGNKVDESSKLFTTRLQQDKIEYDKAQNVLVDNYYYVNKHRNELDEKVKMLLGYDNTLIYEKQAILDSAIYTTILWTVLATSVLYYAFTKL
jgi:hypothetical protein